MKHQVPQFIEIEDKIFGPLTIKQFLYVAGGGAISFIMWSIFPKFIAIVIAIPILIFFLALAFYKFNNRPLILAVESAIKYFFNNKIYIWKKKEKKPVKKDFQNEGVKKLILPKMSDSKLKELTWSLDINENLKDVEKGNLN